MIAAAVIESLVRHPNKPQVAYFFCRYNDNRSLKARTIFGSLAKQLLWEHLRSVQKFRFGENEHLDNEGILEAIKWYLPKSQQGYYIVIDGLDACPTREIEEFFGWLTRLVAIDNTFRIFLTVRASMLDSFKDSLPPHQSEFITSEDRPEIREYVEVELNARWKKGHLAARNEAQVNTIVETLIGKCDGM